MNKKLVLIIIFGSIIGVNYYLEVNKIQFYPILRYLFIIPIILSSFYFNILGGIVSGCLAASFYLPLLISSITSGGMNLHSLELLFTIFFFISFSLFFGIVINNMNKEEDKLFKLNYVIDALNKEIEEEKLINTINNSLSSVLSFKEIKFYKDKIDELKNDEFIYPIKKDDELIATIIAKSKTKLINNNDIVLLDTLSNQFILSLSKVKTYEEVTNEREYLQSIINNLSYGILTVDKYNRIKICNVAAMKFFEKNIPDELLNKEDDYFEMNYNNLPIGVRCSKLKEEKIICFKDISDEKKLLTLEEKNKLKSEFIHTAFHELRTPLTSIKGFITTIQEGNLSKEELHQFQKIIYSEADRLKKVINNFLNLKIIEQEKSLPLTLKKFDIEDLIRKVVDSKKVFTTLHQFAIIKNTNITTLTADYDKIYQVIYNLLDNAIKYSPGGGMIKIIIEEDDEYLKIAVEDEGIGIPQGQLNKLFKKFCKIDREKYTYPRGLGYGLYLTKYIIDRHNGKIFAESKEGKGSKFTLLLPKFFQ